MKQRIGKTLLRYESDPLQHAEPLKQLELGSYRFRIGDYRVVFDIEGDEIVILRIGHRRDIYTIAHSIPANQTLERRKAKQ